MGYTKFGEYFKILRIKNHEVLADVKEFLGCSSAFISSVECGHRTVPVDWYEKIVKHYNLKEVEQKELRKVIEDSKKSIHIDIANSNATKRDMAIQFQRSFDKLDENAANEILNILKSK